MVVLSKLVSVVTLSTFFGSVFASPLPGSPLESRQSGYLAVTGSTIGGVKPRLEIRTLQQDATAWNLFLLSLQAFLAMNQSVRESYFQIAGIHGQPHIDWDGVAGVGTTPVTIGYCPHGSNLFGPWHRPYMAIFEQILAQQAQTIAAQFPDGQKAAYQAAANNLRWPYWDWANAPATGSVVPASCSTPTISVTYPNGTTASIANPLYSYKFHPLNGADFAGNSLANFPQQPQTIRNPINPMDANAQSQPAVTEATFKAVYVSQRARLLLLFSVYQSYNAASNKGSGGTLDNFENVHDVVHSSFGTGHMGYLSVSAFDPIFWLHHSNIDRLLAIWQKIYPDTYIDPASQTDATYTIPAGSIQDVNSPLKPFHSDTAGSFHTSASVRTTEPMGYTYPELADNPTNATLIARVQALYGVNTQAPLSRREAQDTAAAAATAPRDYYAKILLPWTALSGSYSVAVFLGSFNAANPKTWYTSASYVGSHATLASPAMALNSVLIPGAIKLNAAIRKKYQSGELKSTDEATVVAYLKKNLHWRVEKGGALINRVSVARLGVSIESIGVKPATSSGTFPTWTGAWKKYPQIIDA